MYFAKIVFWSSVVLLSTLHSWTLQSPDAAIEVTLEMSNNQPAFAIKQSGAAIVSTSPLGLKLNPDFEGGFTVIGTDTLSFDKTWKPVWDQFSTIRNYYQQLIVRLQETGSRKRKMNVVVRAYNDGVAIRYEFPDAGTYVITGDRTQFAFSGDHTSWSYNGENDPIGPSKISSMNSYKPPLVMQAGNNSYIALLEAAIFDCAPFTLNKVGGTTVGVVMGSSTVHGPAKTSWRTLLAGSSPGALLESTLLPSLNPPCAIADLSWVKPGLCLWDWRVWGYKAADGFTYGLNVTSWLRMIDFAKDNNFKYLAIDADWYGAEGNPNSNPLTFASDKDVKKAIAYGKEKDVGLLLYINDVVRRTGTWPLQEVFAEWGKWGAAGVKYGFMQESGQSQVKVTRDIIKWCADNKLLVNFHDGPVPPSGDRRTYPNKYGVEYCHAQADALKDFKPTCFMKAVFVNMLAGPLDMGNGWYALNNARNERVRVFTDIQSTVVSETARIFCTFSGVSMIPDAPEEYAKKADLFEFLRNMPMHWDETRILNGEIGKVITMARRKGKEWFIGSVIDEKGGTVNIDLQILDEGRKYFATLYEDADNTNYISNKESYRVRKDTLEKGDIVKAKLAPGGGHCIWLRPDTSTVGTVAPARIYPNGEVLSFSVYGYSKEILLPGSGFTHLVVSTLRGETVCQLPVHGTSVRWNGSGSHGSVVGNGVYLIRGKGPGRDACEVFSLFR